MGGKRAYKSRLEKDRSPRERPFHCEHEINFTARRGIRATIAEVAVASVNLTGDDIEVGVGLGVKWARQTFIRRPSSSIR